MGANSKKKRGWIASGTGRALSNPAPKSRAIHVGERYTGHRRNYRCLARGWPAPIRLGLGLPGAPGSHMCVTSGSQ